MENKVLTSEAIRSMSESEWNEFRQKSWNRKKEYYNREMPDNYLGSKEKFADYIDRAKRKRK